jgi:ribosomal protein S12 methylthiotransferase
MRNHAGSAQVCSEKNHSFYIISLGCSKNLVDSERVNGSLIRAGFHPVESSEDAEIIIINTCGFIEAAKEESIETIFEAVGSGDKKIAVVGCLSQRYRDALLSEIPEIDFLYGIPDDNFVREFTGTFSQRKEEVPFSEREPLLDSLPYSYIKISDGCSNNCSYCAIPLIRGAHRSFPPEMVLGDVRAAVKRGSVEMNIVAQDISRYRSSEIKLENLVEMISEIDGVRWVRLLYCHPDHLDDSIINIIRENEKVVRYIDIPFQHVSGEILESMGRRGDYDSYLRLLSRIRDNIPGIAVRSTFMVGYPGETDEDFQLMCEFLKEAKLDKAGCFTYSREEDTAAYHLQEQVSDDIMAHRFDTFMNIQKEISAAKLREMIGREVDVLIEGKIDDETFMGRTEFDAPEVDGFFYLTSTARVNNSIVRAKVLDSEDYDLIGVVV